MAGRMRILNLALAFIILASGCSEKSEELDIEKPVVVDVVFGKNIFDTDIGVNIVCAVSFTVIFSKEMKEVDIDVSGASGEITLNGKYATWTAIECTSYDMKYTLVVTGTDISGQELEPFETSFNAGYVISDYFFPRIFDRKCDPKNGAVGVDPQDYMEKLTIVFDREFVEAKVVSTEPEFPFIARILESDRKILEIMFVNYSMPYNTKFVITIYAMSLSGNARESKYSFTTKDE